MDNFKKRHFHYWILFYSDHKNIRIIGYLDIFLIVYSTNCTCVNSIHPYPYPLLIPYHVVIISFVMYGATLTYSKENSYSYSKQNSYLVVLLPVTIYLVLMLQFLYAWSVILVTLVIHVTYIIHQVGRSLIQTILVNLS